jgi:hypothetical protein
MESDAASCAGWRTFGAHEQDFLMQGDEPTEDDIYWYLRMKEEDGCLD